MHRFLVLLAALAGFSAVALAALASHLLPSRLDGGQMAAFNQALTLQSWHAPALIVVGLWASRGSVWVRRAGIAMALGLILFCAGVYVHALLGIRLPYVAPTGGGILMLGWLLLGYAALAE